MFELAAVDRNGKTGYRVARLLRDRCCLSEQGPSLVWPAGQPAAKAAVAFAATRPGRLVGCDVSLNSATGMVASRSRLPKAVQVVPEGAQLLGEPWLASRCHRGLGGRQGL